MHYAFDKSLVLEASNLNLSGRCMPNDSMQRRYAKVATHLAVPGYHGTEQFR